MDIEYIKDPTIKLIRCSLISLHYVKNNNLECFFLVGGNYLTYYFELYRSKLLLFIGSIES